MKKILFGIATFVLCLVMYLGWSMGDDLSTHELVMYGDEAIQQLPEDPIFVDMSGYTTFDASGIYIGGGVGISAVMAIGGWNLKTTIKTQKDVAVIDSKVDRNREDIKEMKGDK